jgi:stage II sporulation protein D
MKYKYGSILLTLSLMVVLASCAKSPEPSIRKVRYTSNQVFYHTFALQLPLIRIGLVEKANSSCKLTASGGLFLLSADGQLVSNQPFKTLSFFIKGFDGSEPEIRFRLQVGSFKEKKSADAMASSLRKRFKLPVVVRYNDQYSTYRVQIGAFQTRGEAGAFQNSARTQGIEDTLIVTEKEKLQHAGVLNAVNIDGSFISSSSRFTVVPASQESFLRIGETDYRGVVELRIASGGKIQPINILNLEEYLKGVVPAEMSSTVYPQIEALKAQTLAARTYAVRNMGQYSSQGFDICDTAACQVYKGMNIEQQLTNAAIEQTRHEIITYQGEPINALFSSTSGGHTEDVENIFPGEPVPYLRGVVSRPGKEAVRYISGPREVSIIPDRNDRPLNYHLDVLRFYGFEFEKLIEAEGEAKRKTLLRALKLLSSVFEGTYTEKFVDEEVRLIDALVLITDALNWRKIVDGSVSPLDLDLLFPGDNRQFNEHQQKVVIYFLRFGLIVPEPDGNLPLLNPLTNKDLIRLLYSVLDYQNIFTQVRGNLVNRGDSLIHLEVGRVVRSFRLSSDVSLYQDMGEFLMPVTSLRPVSGDMLRATLQGDEIRILVHEPSRQGHTNDRFSKYHHWDVSYSMQELTEKVAKYVDIGDVVDLVPLRIGVSKRIVELKVIGSKSNAVFKGLRVRWALGLRDTLFTILRIRDNQGKQKGWRFVGSGWGHGVGLCQVGSYGMALNGATYREIVEHYYTGVKVEKVNSSSFQGSSK